MLAYLKVVGVQVGLVLGILAVSGVTGVNDGVEHVSENLVGLLITGNTADGHDEGMSGVVHTGLDDAVEGASGRSDLRVWQRGGREKQGLVFAVGSNPALISFSILYNLCDVCSFR